MIPIEIGGRSVGPGQPCLVIAEAGVNHNGDPDIARRMIDAAAGSGVDAVKFQTFSADRVVTPGAPKARYQIENTDANESQLEMLRRLELSTDAHRMLAAHAASLGLMFLSTPADEISADFLESLGVCAFKISSAEITNTPLLSHVAAKKRPMIVSTGMATLDEVRAAVTAVVGAGNEALVLLHCVSAYPAEPAEINLRAMSTLRDTFGCVIGYSDHTVGRDIAVASVALGAAVVEKHFTLDRSMEGPDHRASIEPDEMTQLVTGIRAVEAAMGVGRKVPTAREHEVAAVVRKSLVAAVDIAAGEILTDQSVAAKRPGTGLAPSKRESIVGRAARRNIPSGTVLTLDMLS